MLREGPTAVGLLIFAIVCFSIATVVLGFDPIKTFLDRALSSSATHSSRSVRAIIKTVSPTCTRKKPMWWDTRFPRSLRANCAVIATGINDLRASGEAFEQFGRLPTQRWVCHAAVARECDEFGNSIIVALAAILDDRDIQQEWCKAPLLLLLELRKLRPPMRVLLIDKTEYTLQQRSFHKTVFDPSRRSPIRT